MTRLRMANHTVEKLGALYWRKVKAAAAGGDMFVVAREILLECLREFDSRTLESGGTLGSDLVRRYCAERRVSMAEVFAVVNPGVLSNGSYKRFMQRGCTPSLLLATQIELFTGGIVPCETWLFGGGSVQGEKLKQARRYQVQKLKKARDVASAQFLRVRHEILLSLKRWTRERLPERYATKELPTYRQLKDYAIAKGFTDAQERFYTRCAPSAAIAEDWRVLCGPDGKPIPPGDYDSTLERYSYEEAERRRTRTEEGARKVRERLSRGSGVARSDGEENRSTGPAGS